LEFYTVNKDGSKILVNDSSNTNAVKAYWKRTAAYGPFVKYAGPTSFVSPFAGPDVGFTNINVVISDGSSAKVDPSTATLAIDGSTVTATKSSTNGLTTLSFTPTGLQLPRTIHTGAASFAETGAGATSHSNTWSFNLLRNMCFQLLCSLKILSPPPRLPTLVLNPPSLTAGWRRTTPEFKTTRWIRRPKLGLLSRWVVVDKSFGPSKDFGVSAFTPQVLNGVAFAEDTNPLLSNHYMRAETDSRQNGPPGQIQYVTTKAYNLSGRPAL